MMNRKQFDGLAATTKNGAPTMQQIKDNGGMPSKFKTESHTYDTNRPKRPVVSWYK